MVCFVMVVSPADFLRFGPHGNQSQKYTTHEHDQARRGDDCRRPDGFVHDSYPPQSRGLQRFACRLQDGRYQCLSIEGSRGVL
jgi:hypothetical protein